jgi:type IV pilus assembly protein PilF
MRWQLIKVIYFILSGLCLLSCQTIPDKTNQSIANTDIALAMNYLQRQQWDLAKQYLLIAKNLAPTDPAVWYSLAYYEEKTGNNIAADQDYRYAIQLAPHLGEAHNNYGVFLCQQGYHREAIKQFSLAAHTFNYAHRGRAYKNAVICQSF